MKIKEIFGITAPTPNTKIYARGYESNLFVLIPFKKFLNEGGGFEPLKTTRKLTRRNC